MTRFGGSGADSVTAMAVNASGEIYIGGTTSSRDLPANNRPFSSNLYRIDGTSGRPVFSLPGDVLSLSPDPRFPATLWAGTSVGVYRSSDGGDTWARIRNGLPADGFRVAVDPANGSIIYAAPNSKDADRIYRTADHGDTWISLPLGTVATLNGIVVDPTRPATVFLRTASGSAALRSLDSGSTWATCPHYPVSFDLRRPGVSFGPSSGITRALYRTTDHGTTWTALATPGNAYRILLHPARSGVLYAMMYGPVTNLFRSVNDGVTWTRTGFPEIVGDLAADPSGSVLYASTERGLIRSIDGFETWTAGPVHGRYGSNLLWTGIPAAPGALAPLFVGSTSTSDAYVAKLDSAGKLISATYLGGSSDDTATTLTISGSGVYVAGTTFSTDFTGMRSGGEPGHVFVSRLTASLDRVEETVTFGGTVLPSIYSSFSYYVNPTALVIDASGTAKLGVYYFRLRCWRVDEFHPCQFYPDPESLLYSLNPSSMQTPSSQYVGSPSPDVVLAAPDGGLYIAGDDNVRKLKHNGDLEFSAGLSGANIRAGTFDRSGNLVLTGDARCAADFYTTPAAFQPAAEIPYVYGHQAFLAVLTPDASSVLYSTCFGELGDSARAVAVDAANRPVIAGGTTSHRFPTRSPLTGGFDSAAGFVSLFNPVATELLFSTFLTNPEPFEVRALTLDSAGNLLAAGQTAGTTSGDSEVIVQSLAVSGPDDSPRIDAVLNAASLDSTPLVPLERVVVRTVGVPAEARFLVDGVTLSRAADGTFTMPGDIDARPIVEVAAAWGGEQTRAVSMPTARRAPALFTADGSGRGQAVAYNEDGTPNSASNPAPHGTLITVPVNGAGLNAGDVPIKVYLNQLSSPGLVTIVNNSILVNFRVPYFNQPPYVNYLPPLIAQLLIEIGGTRSQTGVTLAVVP